MKRIILFLIIIGLNSCSKTEFKIVPIPGASLYWTGGAIEYFDVFGSDRLSNKQMIEKLKQHTLESLNTDSVKAYDFRCRIYYKHSYFSKYNISKGSKWDSEGIRDIDSPDLFGAFDRRVGLVWVHKSDSLFEFISYVDKSTNRLEETDSTFFAKMKHYQSKK